MVVLHCFGEELKRRICQLCNLCAEWSLSIETQCSCLAGDGESAKSGNLGQSVHLACDVIEVVDDRNTSDEGFRLSCNRCSLQDFPSLGSLIVHYLDRHQPEPGVDSQSAQLHLQRHQPVRGDCGDEFTTDEQNLHGCVNSVDELSKRSSGGEVMSSEATKRAKTTSRSTVRSIRSWVCTICYDMFSTQSARRTHMKRVHPGQLEKSECRTPEKLSWTKSRSTVRSIRSWVCTICYGMFSTQSARRTHMKRVHPGQLEKSECRTPEKLSWTKSRSTVRSIRSWVCTICYEMFSTQSARRTHMKRVHPGQLEKSECPTSEKLSCHLCIETFKTELKLSNHLATNHKDHDQSSKEEKHDLETSTRGHSDSSNSTVIEVSFTQHAADVSGTVQVEGVELDSKNNTENRDCVEMADPDNSDSSDGQPAGTDIKAFPVETLASRELPAVAQCQAKSLADAGQPPSAPVDITAAEHNARLRQKWQQKYPNRTIVPHECNTCGQQFMQAVQLRKHMIRHIEQESTTLACEIEFPYTCCVCTRHFLFANDLKRHLISHSDDRPHQCKVCQRQFKRDDDLTKHMKMHGDVRPYVCEICSDSFESSTRLRKHVRRVHGNRYVCNVCGQRFAKRSLLGYHNHVYHGDSSGDNSAKPYICDRCGKAFAVESDLRTHMYANHARRRTPLHACRWCRRQFSSVSHLASHERTHTGDRPYTCDLCGKQFTQSGSLNVHKRTHTEPQPFACNQCGQRFASKQYAKKHMAMRHGVT